MNTWDKCKNCGGERGLHHYQTMQCPVDGREAPIGRKDEWMSNTFEPDTSNELKELRDEIAELKRRVAELEDDEESPAETIRRNADAKRWSK